MDPPPATMLKFVSLYRWKGKYFISGGNVKNVIHKNKNIFSTFIVRYLPKYCNIIFYRIPCLILLALLQLDLEYLKTIRAPVVVTPSKEIP